MNYAYYANDEYRPNGKNPRGVKVTKAEWIESIEDAEPTPTDNQVIVRDQILENGKHRKRKVLRDKTPAELGQDVQNAADTRERLWFKNNRSKFKDNSATDEDRNRAILILSRGL